MNPKTIESLLTFNETLDLKEQTKLTFINNNDSYLQNCMLGVLLTPTRSFSNIF